MSSKLRSYSANAIAEIIPLDKASINELIDYALTLSDHEVQNHFLNLLGESPAAIAFATKFLELKHETNTEKTWSEGIGGSDKGKQQDVPKGQKVSQKGWGTEVKKDKSGGKPRAKTAGSKTVSQLLDMKPSNTVSPDQQKKNKKKRLEDLRDIDAILMSLELKQAEGKTNRVCNCNATKHPLFELAPNCLNCGKIICVKEGLQPCSYCGKDLLSTKDRREIVEVLRQEKEGLEEKSAHPQNKRIQGKSIKYALTAGENLWEAQDRALKKADEEARRSAESRKNEETHQKQVREQQEALDKFAREHEDADLAQAQARLDTLLQFQDSGAERTKIIDNAADYEMPSESSSSLWLSPVERALQLKKQQRQQRKQTEAKKSRTGRGKRVVEMVIRDGKVTMVERDVVEDVEDPEIADLEEEVRMTKKSDERMLAMNVWDYEKDKERWERPTYEVGERVVEKRKVQMGYDPEENELLPT